MKLTNTLAFAALSSLALAACDSGTSNGTVTIKAVGSSTVFPFAKKVSEEFALNNPDFGSPIIESTGSGKGFTLFCAGAGADTPSMTNASRRMKKGEFETCGANGVAEITELQVGLDGIAFASKQGGITMNLTPEAVYKALAAKPYGKEQTAKNWSDIDPSYPNKPILVYGPPSTSGTRDALKELILEAGCKADPAMKELKESDEDRYDQICTEVRSDGVFVETGENDNLIVSKLAANADAVGVFGYSYLEENLDKVHGLSMNGVEPTYENIASFTYPGARPLFVYVKKSHLDAVPGLKQFVAQWAKMWKKDGPLAKIGLVANPDDVMAAMDKASTEFPSLDGAELK
ncbi:MAG: substrate-binding domain-containing protein [Sphingomonadaceae bacterium]|nr:substrate-binding domain-containing protein [Sphingomonadaceae bacterium]MCP5390226.1 substrate-binding domain-containing protein [Sphingomonadaceae bacterium]MCP5392441.1 substrate-binding domain-containing protein [Sphingomonadaceae bacterium]